MSVVEFWSYSAIRCCGYPLHDLDSSARLALQETSSVRHQSGGESSCKTNIRQTNRQYYEDDRCALQVILESKQSSELQKAELLASAVIKKLLEEKWRLFGKQMFVRQVLVLALHLCVFALAIALRPNTSAKFELNKQSKQTTVVSISINIIIVILFVYR